MVRIPKDSGNDLTNSGLAALETEVGRNIFSKFRANILTFSMNATETSKRVAHGLGSRPNSFIYLKVTDENGADILPNNLTIDHSSCDNTYVFLTSSYSFITTVNVRMIAGYFEEE